MRAGGKSCSSLRLRSGSSVLLEECIVERCNKIYSCTGERCEVDGRENLFICGKDGSGGEWVG